ncbi:MAG: extensin family protein, partial [Phyllobacterium sp.]
MTLFSRHPRYPAFVLVSLTACIATTVLLGSVADADARHRRGHHGRQAKPVRPPLPALAPVPLANPRAETDVDAPKPEEKPAAEIQKADPQTTPLPDQKPAAEPIPEVKPAEKPAEPPKAETPKTQTPKIQPQGPLPDKAAGDKAKPNHEETVEKADPATSPDRVYQNACPALMNGEIEG